MALITLTRLIDIVLKYANKGFFKNIHKSATFELIKLTNAETWLQMKY